MVAWYGYDIPLSAIGGVPVTPVGHHRRTPRPRWTTAARAGGALLVRDIAQFRQWAPDTARFIGMGFSMGSTTVSAAAARGAGFDDLVLLGSPGAGTEVETAADYPGPDRRALRSRCPTTRTRSPQRTTDVLAGWWAASSGCTTGAQPVRARPGGQDFGAQVIDTPSNEPDPISVHAAGRPVA